MYVAMPQQTRSLATYTHRRLRRHSSLSSCTCTIRQVLYNKILAVENFGAFGGSQPILKSFIC